MWNIRPRLLPRVTTEPKLFLEFVKRKDFAKSLETAADFSNCDKQFASTVCSFAICIRFFRLDW